MLTWAMAWMMVNLGEATGYLLVLSVFGDILVTLLAVALMNAITKTIIAFGLAAQEREQKGGNGTGPNPA